MSSSRASHLSDPRCQCDFVVATTQASINSGLLEYLNEQDQPVQYLCFEQDDNNYPTKQVSLDEVLAKTGGINPFYIPDNVPAGDSRVQALSNANFGVGVMLQMGMPLGHTPDTLPPIVTLNTASNVTFNLFCRDVKVVSITWGRHGAKWNVFSQPQGGQPWSMKVSVDLTLAGLDAKLDTPYFNSHPKARDQLRRQLENLSGTAFSLQQLLFDLDSAVLQTVPDFSSVTDPDAKNILETYFRNIYFKSAKERGLPLVAVTAVAQPEDKSSLQMTAFERIVNRLKDGSYRPISNPTSEQANVTTLDYLCVVDNHPRPQISDLDWNWMQPGDVDDSSGVIAINRDTLAQYIADTLITKAAFYCQTPVVGTSLISFQDSGALLQKTYPASGDQVLHLEFNASAQGDQAQSYGQDHVRCKTRVQTAYKLDLFFQDSVIKVVQWAQTKVTCWLTKIYSNPDSDGISISVDGYEIYLDMTIIDKTLTDTYALSVNQNGGLQLVHSDGQTTDKSDSEPSLRKDPSQRFPDELYDLFVNLLQPFLSQARDNVNQLSHGDLHELQISQLHSFIFPGARVFTYKEPFFSDHQDLVCKITYVDVDEVSPPPQQPQQSQRSPPASVASTAGKLTASTELMQNYVEGETVSPTGRFEALQMSDGHALLFAVDSSGVFHVIEEQSGTSHTGWLVHDLSTAPVDLVFPGRTADGGRDCT